MVAKVHLGRQQHESPLNNHLVRPWNSKFYRPKYSVVSSKFVKITKIKDESND